MASSKPTEAEYTSAMERHGTDAWTVDDQRVMDRWLEQRQPDEKVDTVGNEHLNGTEK